MEKTLDLSHFKVERVLNKSDNSKIISLLGKLKEDSDDLGILILQKKTFYSEEQDLKGLSASFKSINQYFENDIYTRHTILTDGRMTEVDGYLIYPATEKLIKKYSKKEEAVLHETAEFYTKHTYPTLIKDSASQHQWVYNVLNKEKESENIVFDDPDPETGFILLPDISFTKPGFREILLLLLISKDNLEELHLLAIVYRKDIQSLRDLNASHLPLLSNIYNKSRKCIKEKYGLDPNKLKMYVHYQPTYYHFHVHFCHSDIESMSLQFTKAHNFAQIIQNIQFKSDYYQQASLEYIIDKSHKLYQTYLSEYPDGPNIFA